MNTLNCVLRKTSTLIQLNLSYLVTSITWTSLVNGLGDKVCNLAHAYSNVTATWTVISLLTIKKNYKQNEKKRNWEKKLGTSIFEAKNTVN